MKKRIVVVCPGRGSYTKETHGYMNRYRPRFEDFIGAIDDRRASLGEITVSDLDRAQVFKPQVHTLGENASPLIYACSYLDFLNLDPEQYEVVAVTGNSMGWYIALAVGGALDVEGSFRVINTMGSMMKGHIVGGQMIYPIVDQEWRTDLQKKNQVEAAIREVNELDGSEAYLSIRLGGYAVIAGNQKALDFLLKKLPKTEQYPFQLVNHAAFHTPMLMETSQRAFETLPREIFSRPEIPMIDGRGVIWTSYGTDVDALYDYTFGHQVTQTYDFTAAVSVALKEFCPDQVVLLGPGNTLGGVVGQILVSHCWKDIDSKAAFSVRQKESPFLISLGLR